MAQLEAQCVREAIERAREKAKFKDVVNQNTQHLQDNAALRQSLEAESKRVQELQRDNQAAHEQISRLEQELFVLEAQNVLLRSNIELFKQESDVRVTSLTRETEVRLRNLVNECEVRLVNSQQQEEAMARRLVRLAEENELLRQRAILMDRLNAQQRDRMFN